MFNAADGGKCTHCARDLSVQWRVREGHQRAKKLMSDLMDASGVTVSARAPEISEVAAEIVEYFGGVRPFVLRWAEQFEKAMEARPGSMGVLQHFNNVMKLLAEASKQQKGDDISRMSLEQIEAEKKLLAFESLVEMMADPAKREVAGEAARLLGMVPDDLEEVKLVP